MKLLNMLMANLFLPAALCGALSAGALEKGSSEWADLGPAGAAAIPVPAPPASMSASASQAGTDEFFKYLDDTFKAPRAAPVRRGSGKAATAVPGARVGGAVYSFKLEAIRNTSINSGLSFKTPGGVLVKFGGYTASDCPKGARSCADKEKLFLTLTSGRGETSLVRAMDVINYGILMSGSKTVNIGGEMLTVKIDAVASDPPASKVEVSCGGAKVFGTTLKRLADAVAAKGADVRLGRTYKLAYGSELRQGKGAARFTPNMVFIFSPVGQPGYYFLNASDITASGVSYPEMERGFGFRLADGVLGIFRLN